MPWTDPIAWVQAFKQFGDTKTALVLVAILFLLLGGTIVWFVNQVVRKDKFKAALDTLGDTIQANSEKAISTANTAAAQCREDSKLVALSLKEHQGTVTTLSTAVAELSGIIKGWNAARTARPRRKK